jgi:transposase
MEACSGAHYWARLFRQYGHDVRLMAPKFVSPYRMAGKAGKNDAADAIAICEAVQRPHMRFVPVKDEASRQCNAYIGQDRDLSRKEQQRITVFGGLISEFGVIAPQSTDALRHVVSDQKETLPVQVRRALMIY